MKGIMETFPPALLIAAGAGFLSVTVWLLSRIISKTLDDQLDKIKQDNLEGRKEREYDNYLLLRGMQVLGDSEHELI